MSDKWNDTVAIIGQGYVGLPLAMTLVEANWQVIGFDSDEDKTNALIQLKVPFKFTSIIKSISYSLRSK